jgi:hypothetical protein
VLGVAACTAVGDPASPPVPSSGGPAPSTDAAECPDIDLRTPTGERINLNGTWETLQGGHRSGIYYFRQVGSCLWFVGGFPRPEDGVVDEVGALSVVTTSYLVWIDYPHVNVPPAQGGTLDLRIEFEESGIPQLAYVDDVGERFLDPTLVVDELTWVKVDDRWPYPPPVLPQ